MGNKITIIDYGMGNLRSVQRKIENIGGKTLISSMPDDIESASKLILPGVGHFANGVHKLKDYGLWNILNKKVLEHKTPILGICLGMQLMAKHSEEGNCDGLGWFDAEVVRFSVNDEIKYKIPHMGWNSLNLKKKSMMVDKVSAGSLFYFVHSYHMSCENKEDILATTEYEYPFVSAVEKDNIFGAQFHPEKSHDWGETMLSNFISQ